MDSTLPDHPAVLPRAASRWPIYAAHDRDTIRVYQAFSPVIADEAVRLGRFGPSFSRTRMTWIKPSFLWMMFRCGWATKPGQARVLAIDLVREGFDTVAEQAVLTTFDPDLNGDAATWRAALVQAEARCQWDPDHDIDGRPRDSRTIQLGLRGSLVTHYVEDWLVRLSDITDLVVELRHQIELGHQASLALPSETLYRPFCLAQN